MPNYSDLKYWEDRYSTFESTFEWLEDFDSLKQILEICHLNSASNILMLGCGNSELSEKIYDEMNIKNISNIDISSNVIKIMKERNRTRPEISWDVMNAKDLKYPTGIFDVVIDKGTFDSIMCGDNSSVSIGILTKEVQRVLKCGGLYLLISHGNPAIRMLHLNREHLSFNVECHFLRKTIRVNLGNQIICSEGYKDVLSLEMIHYAYTCIKKEGADSNSEQNWEDVYKELTRNEILEEDDDDGQLDDKSEKCEKSEKFQFSEKTI